MYYDLFKQLKLSQLDLKLAWAPLVRFNTQSQLDLKLVIEFVVVDIPSPYNAIVGRDWLHRMKGVASTLHQVIKFVTPKGEKTLYGDQVGPNNAISLWSPLRQPCKRCNWLRKSTKSWRMSWETPRLRSWKTWYAMNWMSQAQTVSFSLVQTWRNGRESSSLSSLKLISRSIMGKTMDVRATY